jgi:cytochrome P450
MPTTPISFLNPEVQRCPFEAYREVRKQGPVYFDSSSNCYIITDYDEVRKAAADTTTFSNVTGQLLVKEGPKQDEIDSIFKEHGFLPVNTLVVADPPVHDFHRAQVDKVFTISRVKKMEEYIRSVVAEMIGEIVETGGVEFVGQFAMKIPTYIIADQLGVPRSDFATFKRWSDAVIRESDPNNTHEEQMALTQTICELQQYIAQKAGEYRESPAECMLSDLVHAEDDGKHLTLVEIISMVMQILVAGNDTTTSAMGSGLYRIITTPGLETKLRGNRDAIGNFVEEVLRYDSPVQGLWRRVTANTRIGQTDIPAGSLVILRFGAANRDPRQFANPDMLEPERKNARQHLAFGTGRHFCVGNQLARAELRTTFDMLLDSMKNFRLARGEEGVGFHAHVFGYGVNHLEISFEKL